MKKYKEVILNKKGQFENIKKEMMEELTDQIFKINTQKAQFRKTKTMCDKTQWRVKSNQHRCIVDLSITNLILKRFKNLLVF